MDNHGIHALVFPCRKNGTEWVDASTKKHVDIQPTHWRKWIEIWPAAGSEDTELGVLLEPEVGHGEAEVYTRVQA